MGLLNYLFPKPADKEKTDKISADNSNVLKGTDSQDTINTEEKATATKEITINKKLTSEEKNKAKKLFKEGLASVKDIISPASMNVTSGFVKLSEVYAESIYVYTYPRYLDTNWLSPIINFEATMDTSIYIYPIDSASIMKTLRNRVGQIGASIHMAQEKGKVRDPLMQTAYEDAEELRDKLARGEEKFFQFALYITVYHEDQKVLKKIVKQIEAILGGKLILTKKAILRQEQALNTTLPMCQDELVITRNMNTSPLSSSFPFTSSDLSSDSGILYGLNRHNNSLVIFDRFSLPNANSVAFATSGAGKSYAIKLEILRSLMLGTDVIVIDPENEYEKLSDVVGGSYMRVSLNADRRINPFDLPLPVGDQPVEPGDLLRSNIITLQGLLDLMMGGNLTPEEKAILEKALIETYTLKGITMTTENPGEIPPPTMEDLADVLSEMKGASNLLVRLEQYTQGIFSGIFNKPTNVNLESGFVCFCIRDLEERLRPIAMYIILNYIWNTVRSSLKKRILVIDEAWSLMQYEDSANFLYGLVKRARKYYLGITTITQDVSDFLESPKGKAIISNSSMQLLLKQAPSSIDQLAEIFNLTDGEKYYLLNSAQGEGLFFADQKHVAIQIISSFLEDKTITTNPEDILKEEEDKKDINVE